MRKRLGRLLVLVVCLVALPASSDTVRHDHDPDCEFCATRMTCHYVASQLVVNDWDVRILQIHADMMRQCGCRGLGILQRVEEENPGDGWVTGFRDGIEVQCAQ